MSVSIISVDDGNRTTVDDLKSNPLMVPARIMELLDNQFLDDVIFRDAGANATAIMEFEQSTPLFLDDESETVAEFSEIPVGAGRRGLRRIAVGVKKGRGVRISKEMVDENKIDDVNRQIIQLTNTMIRARHRAARAALLADSAVPTIAATAAWGTTGSRIRRDVMAAVEVVSSAVPDGSSAEDVLGFEPDTIILPGSITPVLMDDEDFLKIFVGDIAGDSPAYTGTMPRQIAGMLPLRTRFWPGDRALVLERGTIGKRSDARPLQVTELYGEGNGPNGGPTESWRSDATYKRVLGVDQPLAACWITGINEL
jgi:hypothetical protein